MLSLNAARTVASNGTENSVRINNTRFEDSLTPMEFVNKFGQADAALDEAPNSKKLRLSCKDNRGVVIAAYAAGKLQQEYAACRDAGKEFALPEKAMVAPFTDQETGRTRWMLYLQGDLDLSASRKAFEGKISQDILR